MWVSEIMLQQTRVATVKDYYNKWMKVKPTFIFISFPEKLWLFLKCNLILFCKYNYIQSFSTFPFNLTFFLSVFFKWNICLGFVSCYIHKLSNPTVGCCWLILHHLLCYRPVKHKHCNVQNEALLKYPRTHQEWKLSSWQHVLWLL